MWVCQRPDGSTGSCDRGGGPLPRYPARQSVADQLRQRVQQANLGHRACEDDPLYLIGSRLLTAQERFTGGRARLLAGLAAGGPGGEVAAAWRGKALLRSPTERSVRRRPAALGRFCHWCSWTASRSLSCPGWLVPQ
jgi:hypothetical protein